MHYGGEHLVDVESLKAQVLSLPEVAAWPEMVRVLEETADRFHSAWELPLLACQAVGGDVSEAVSGAAAIMCMHIGIMLVDDILDQDPRGEYRRMGSGPTANLALAFQAAAFERAAVDAEQRAAITSSLAWMALTTALGQSLDTQNLGDEVDYWRVVRAKSTPFFGTSFHIGALLASADMEIIEPLRDLGILYGEVVQIYDDLTDALQSPANPDWKRGRNNLPILYALTADHPDRARFAELLPQVDDPQMLREAQQILIRCGAVSFCAYHLIQRYQKARRLLESIPLADSSPLTGVLTEQIQPLVELFQSVGVELPAELLTG